METNENKKIVTIGGGTGQYVLLSSLRDLPNLDLASIVAMFDSGGSTGKLRDQLGVLPPGDILKCLLALSPEREVVRKIFQRRFSLNEKLRNHTVGNMLLTMLSNYTNSFPEAIEAFSEILDIKGKVFPVTTDKTTLVAELEDGQWLYGEAAIDVPRGDSREKIKKVFLVPHHNNRIDVYPAALETIKKADYLIIGPGDLYSSIIPNFLVPEVSEAIRNSHAKIIYIVNIMTKFGETDNYYVQDFVEKIEENIGCKCDLVVVNSTRPNENYLLEYKKEQSFFVEIDPKREIELDRVKKADLLCQSEGLVRHDNKKLAELIKNII